MLSIYEIACFIHVNIKMIKYKFDIDISHDYKVIKTLHLHIDNESNFSFPYILCTHTKLGQFNN